MNQSIKGHLSLEQMKLAFLILSITTLASGRILILPKPAALPIREIVYMTTAATTTAPYTSPTPEIEPTWVDFPLENGFKGTNAVKFFKNILSVLGTKEAEELAKDLKSDFKALDVDGKLGDTLISLFELRLEDLLTTVEHYKKMRTVLDNLTKN